MLTLYLVALALGGTFVLATLILGGDGESDLDHGFDADFDLDMDMDMDADADAAGGADSDSENHSDVGVIDGVFNWLPVMSLRFWTFFLAFFGLTGTILTILELSSSESVIAAISGIIGYASGWAVVASIRHLSRTQTDSTVSENDYVGATGRVMLPVGKDKIGKIRIELKGRTVELLAKTDDDTLLGARQAVIVYALADDDEHVLVTKAA